MGWPKAEEGERVGLGWTGPRERSERAKSGSEASRLMASEREEEAWGWGLTVGPAEELGAGGGGGGAFVRCCGAGVGVDVDVGGRGPLGPLGYWRAAAPAAFEPEAPIVCEVLRVDESEVFSLVQMLMMMSRSRYVLCCVARWVMIVGCSMRSPKKFQES